MNAILHIATRQNWEQAWQSGVYRPSSLDSEGFIHFSTPAQVLRSAHKHFAGQRDLVLLVVDPARLAAELRYEDVIALDGSVDQFPHLYGTLNTEAVIQSFDFSPDADGRFGLPPELAAD
jgi:uncharacterized protein (DUF952 family)